MPQTSRNEAKGMFVRVMYIRWSSHTSFPNDHIERMSTLSEIGLKRVATYSFSPVFGLLWHIGETVSSRSIYKRPAQKVTLLHILSPKSSTALGII